MFRELRRIKQKLSDEECIEVLENEKRGILSVLGDDGYPYAMPMNHYYNPSDGCIYFHSGRGGYRNDCLARNNKVCFCVHDEGKRKEGEWALNVRSVVVFGRVEAAEDIETVTEIATKLSLKFTQDEAYIRKEIDSFARVTVILKLVPDNICGKIVNES